MLQASKCTSPRTSCTAASTCTHRLAVIHTAMLTQLNLPSAILVSNRCHDHELLAHPGRRKADADALNGARSAGHSYQPWFCGAHSVICSNRAAACAHCYESCARYFRMRHSVQSALHVGIYHISTLAPPEPLDKYLWTLESRCELCPVACQRDIMQKMQRKEERPG